MLLRFFQHVVVRRWFVFVIVRFAIIFAHRKIGEFIPHQDAAQIGMAVEVDAVEIEDLAFLKFRAAPDRSERGKQRAFCAIVGSQPDDNRPMFVRHRVKVINRLEITGKKFLLRLLDFLFLAFDHLFHLHLFLHRAIEPIDAGHVGAVIEAQGRDHRAGNVRPRMRARDRGGAKADSPDRDWE